MRIKYFECIGSMHKCWIMYECAGRVYVYLFGRMERFDMRKRYWWLCWSMQKRCTMHRFGKRLSLCLRQRFHRYVLHLITNEIVRASLTQSHPNPIYRLISVIAFIYHFIAISIWHWLPLINLTTSNHYSNLKFCENHFSCTLFISFVFNLLWPANSIFYFNVYWTLLFLSLLCVCVCALN